MSDTNDWRPFTEHQFPWEHKHLVVMAFAHDVPTCVEIFRVRVAEYGALFPEGTAFLTILERGWVPYAWRLDDAPLRDDEKYPPMWFDYLSDRTPEPA